MRGNEKIVWTMWVRLQELRESDGKGKIKCACCCEMFGYTDMNIKVIFKQFGFPFWFLTENNYFCCDLCDTKENLKAMKAKNKDLVLKFKQIPLSYSDADMVEAIQKLARKLKNHDTE
jgi:hypothetical protein